MAGNGIVHVSDALVLEAPEVRQVGSDVYLQGQVRRGA
jgi:hypothetical protein